MYYCDYIYIVFYLVCSLFLQEHCFLVYSNLFTLYVATNNSPSTAGYIYPNSESLTTNQLLLHTLRSPFVFSVAIIPLWLLPFLLSQFLFVWPSLPHPQHSMLLLLGCLFFVHDFNHTLHRDSGYLGKHLSYAASPLYGCYSPGRSSGCLTCMFRLDRNSVPASVWMHVAGGYSFGSCWTRCMSSIATASDLCRYG